MRTWPRIALVSCLLAGHAAQARPTRYLRFSELFHEADRVVMARPVANRLTKRATLPDISQCGADGGCQPVIAQGVDTEFAVIASLKGGAVGSLVFEHFVEPPNQAPSLNAPMRVAFDPTKSDQYLLFLKCDASNRCVAATGQIDPYGSVYESSTVNAAICNEVQWALERHRQTSGLYPTSLDELLESRERPNSLGPSAQLTWEYKRTQTGYRLHLSSVAPWEPRETEVTESSPRAGVPHFK
jgi:hypothetical protein